jgi:hypothetical protein
MHANEFGVLYVLLHTMCAIHRACSKEIHLNLRHSFSVLHQIVISITVLKELTGEAM